MRSYFDDLPEFESILSRYNIDPLKLYTFFSDNGDFDGAWESQVNQDVYEYIRHTVYDKWNVSLSVYGQGMDDKFIRFMDGLKASFDKHYSAIGTAHQLDEIIKDLGKVDKPVFSITVNGSQSSLIDTIGSDVVEADFNVDLTALSDEQWLEMLVS